MRLQLSLALAVLAAVSGAASARGPATSVSIELAGYADSDHVKVATPSLAGTIGDEAAGWSVGGRYLVDAVSAASVDIVSTASGRFTEVRHVGSLEASYRRGAVSATASGNVSHEPDYLSFGAGFVLAIDLLDKNLTPFFGGRYGYDDVGRTGLPKERWELLQKGGLQAGATFVINRALLASVQLDADFERGYLAKPYRYIPLFAPGTAQNIPSGAAPELVSELRLNERPIDALPTDRDRYALTGRIAGRLSRATLRLDERIYADSWGLWASTADARVMVDLGKRWLLWPHLRIHNQSSVSFWQRAYEASLQPDGTLAVPRYRTGDRELSRLDTVTGGLGAKVRLTHSVHSPWFLSFQFDAAYTRYLDALYITRRWSLFSSLGVSAQWD